MTFIRSLTSAVALTVLLFAGASHAADKVLLGTVGSGGALSWPLYVGLAKGTFAKQGIDVELISAPSSAAVQQQVAAGSVNIGTGGFVDPIRAIDKGAPMKILRVEAKAAPYVVFAKPSIKSYGELKGKTIMVGGAKDITRIYLERMLTPNGVKPGEYDLVYAGATAARFASLQSGAVDATIITSPFNFKAESAGFTKLGVTTDYVNDFPFAGYSVNTQWAKSHPQQVHAFLKGYADAMAWLVDPKNRSEAVEILIKNTGAVSDDAAKSYDFFKEIDLYDVAGSVPKSGLAKLLVVMKDLGELEGPADISRFYDPAFVTD